MLGQREGRIDEGQHGFSWLFPYDNGRLAEPVTVNLTPAKLS